MKSFFDDRSLLVLIDQLAQRYKKTPYEIVSQMTMEEFDFNVAVMLVANIEANKLAEERVKNVNGKSSGPKKGWGAFGIQREIVTKGKA